MVGLCTFLLLGLVAISLYNGFTATRMERTQPFFDGPKVSLLIPARNEALSLREHLPLLLQNQYRNLEVLLLDDASEDSTAQAIERFKAEWNGNLKLISGRSLPNGWVGKSWACHQLSQEATGEIWIFCDADVAISPSAIGRTVALMEGRQLNALTALPQQRMETWLERAVIPFVMHLPVVGLLPLNLVAKVRFPSLSIANGQWLAFRKKTYEQIGGHSAVCDSLVEDMDLAKRLKAHGCRLLVVLAVQDLSVRMYRNGRALRDGFEKNLYFLLGGHALPFSLALLAAVLVFGVALFHLQTLLLLLLFRLMAAYLFKFPFRFLAWHPVGFLLFLGLSVESWWKLKRGVVVWKGRKVRWKGHPKSFPGSANSLDQTPA